MNEDNALRRGSVVHVDFRSGSRLPEQPRVVVRRSTSGRWLVLEVAGELDLEAGSLLDDVGDDPSFVVLDLHEVTFMDCSSLRVLRDAQRRARAAAGTLRLAAASVPVLRILALTRLDRAFPTFDTVREAISLPVTAGGDPMRRSAVPSAERLTERWDGAVRRRMTIEQARGALAQIHGISPEDAFTLMRVYSASHSRHLSEIARLVVEDPAAVLEVTACMKPNP